MNDVLDLLIAHHVPWFAAGALILLGISYWPQVRGLWTRGRREGPKNLTELREQLKAVERRQGTLTEPGKTPGQPGTRSNSAKD